jgi:hypothetical protein
LKIGCPRCTPALVPGAGRGACGGTVARYTGRGPVIGIITRRFSGTRGASGVAALGGLLFAPVVAPPATGGAVVVSVVGELFAPVVAPPATGAAAGAVAAAGALGAPAAGGRTAAGFTTTGALLGGGADAIAGRASCPAGGFAITGPTGGRDAIAGAAVTIFGPCRGCGTILRGAFVTAGAVVVAVLAAGAFVTGAAGVVAAFFAAAGGAATTGFAAGAGAAATAPRRGFCAAVSSSLRC